MRCGLAKYKKEIPTHYVGSAGNEYPISEYCNHGTGAIKHGLKDLPKNEYPYTYKYSTIFDFLCCRICECKPFKL